MKNLIVFLLPVFLISCATPSRLGVSYKGEAIHRTTYKILDNPSINVYVNSLSKEDDLYDLSKVKSRFILSVNKNESLLKILKTYPTAKLELAVTPSEMIKRTWILDALFFYPFCGYFPITPWWGRTNLSSVLTLEIGSKHIDSFDFSASEDFQIMSYPYYRGGKILTQKYSLAYERIFNDVSNFNFCEILASVCEGLVLPEEFTDDISSITTADVDNNIPENKIDNINAFAVIIGNENYANEINVLYAKNDAQVFKQYAIKTLGIPVNNIHTITNATYGQMLNEIDWINKVANAYKGESKLVFYYAGHGMPNEIDKSAYLLPVDGNSTNTATAIKLEYLYNKLSEYETESTTVFFDACFSGGSREGTLVKGRGVKVKPKVEPIIGNIVVFSSSTGDETSLPYKEMQHGLFTYFLLKKLQDSRGNVTYGELFDYISLNVMKQSVVNGKLQNPQINCNGNLIGVWSKWKFN